ncbi:MAG TPA: (Fe-S)-binding protein [Bacteroidales bacterium]|nr:(Fe-S)-binding protein [Bacteroidales bacterium]
MPILTDKRIQKGLSILENFQDSKLLTHLNSCVHCGLCAETCLYYLTFKDPRFIPAQKVDFISSIYKRYCTFIGRNVPFLVNARDLNEENLKEMVDLFFGACTMCGRCTLHCSIGVDIAYLVRTGRVMLAEMGLIPSSIQSTVDAAINTGNNMGITTEEFTDTIQWLEDDLKDDLNDPNASIPLNEKGKKILYTLNPREPKFFPLSISAMAKIFHVAGESWTLSTEMYDVTNYGFFTGSRGEASTIVQHLYDEMKNLGSQELILAECGHGSRAFRWEGPNYLHKNFDFTVKTSVELMADYLREGRIKVNKKSLKQRVTLHDPCNLVRNGGVIQEQRFILDQIADDFVEMTPHGIDNYCCGGGGGQLAMSEYNERRMKIGGKKAEQIRNTGAQIVVTPCHNCVDQLLQINSYYKLDVQIKTLAEVVADALIV